MMPRSICIWTLIATLWLLVVGPGFAQEAGLNAPLSSAGPGKFLGVDRCERCHQAPTKSDIDNRVTDFVLLNESKVWIGDIHSQAYRLIEPAAGTLSKQICDKLQITDISQEQRCLSCHSNWLQRGSRPPTYQRGVACESCHGASEHWDVPHSRADWRTLPVAKKEELGMIDVRNPIQRAEQCFGCHIGSAAEGKVITHAMYAAGHPPLPGIEIESFAAQMPRHWRYLEEKVADTRSGRGGNEGARQFTHVDAFVRENHRYLKLKETNFNEQIAAHNHRAAAVVLGGVVALRESIELMRDSAGDEGRESRGWPELANYDCRACHHELRMPSERQQQRSGLTPGRPIISSWPTTLIRLAIRHVSENRPSYDKKLAEFHAKLAAVQSELQRTPFGSPDRVHAACDELSGWLTDHVVEPVSAKPFDDDAVADAITVLIVIGSTEQHDYDAARQIAWALRVLSCDDSVDASRRTTINEHLEDLAPQLRLDLPNSPTHSCHPVSASDASRPLTPLATQLSTTLAATILYDPDQFRERMQKLRDALR